VNISNKEKLKLKLEAKTTNKVTVYHSTYVWPTVMFIKDVAFRERRFSNKQGTQVKSSQISSTFQSYQPNANTIIAALPAAAVATIVYRPSIR
jgi:hypothetical protein